MTIILHKNIGLKILIVVAVVLFCSCSEVNNKETAISFNYDVRPILNDKCLRCHGGVKKNGGLSFLFQEDAFVKTQSGALAIVRGNHKKSELYRRIVSDDSDRRMPYQSEPLSQEEIDIIGKWIDQGAKWEKHWAYIPPNKNYFPPSVNDEGWSENPIDKFIYSKLKDVGLSPSPETDKNTLMRRIFLDLTGLPPSMDEAELFLEDNSVNAYEKLVDRLLLSPHFGERWASMWLDLARYADSKGYEKDTNREIWKYRDWVIHSFNEDKPFNQFTIEQLAGDLLPNPTEQQLIATAFHRNTLANDEGGTDNEEFRIASVIERTSTTYEVWQGTTMSCVQCHSHPYDPFRHNEFYESMAFFNNAADDDSYFEEPKLYTYSQENKVIVEEALEYIYEHLLPEDQQVTNSTYLHDQIESLLTHLGYRFVEAERFDASSPFIELDDTLNFLWQIQDSSWVRYNNTNLTNVIKIGFFVSTKVNYAGDISIHLDSLNGKKVGSIRINQTEDSKIISQGKKIHEYKANLIPVEGIHDIYFQFHKGERFMGHLFYLDKMFYYEKEPAMDSYDEKFRQKLDILSQIPTISTPIIQELENEESRKTFVFDRGSWLSLGKEVKKGIPNIYSVPEEDEPDDRLEFAQWLVSDTNPISARVIVNRFWEQIFGFGLVETLEEFGSQGNKPSHPELLDWLALQLMNEYQWKIKPLLKDLVLSSTYRQSSITDKNKLEHDPSNIWLSRASRTRLSAEQIRDQILAVSGLLQREIGGPSVLNADVDIAGGWKTIPDYVLQGDDAKYRRSLYTFWKRVNPPMNMISFDSPDRSNCTSRRIRTNTPLQALNLLNDKTFYEASQALAKWMLQIHESPQSQIKYGYFRVMGKEIDSNKLSLLILLYEEALFHYKYEVETKEFPEITFSILGEKKYKMAALSVIANTLFNLDEFIVKR